MEHTDGRPNPQGSATRGGRTGVGCPVFAECGEAVHDPRSGGVESQLGEDEAHWLLAREHAERVIR